MIAKCLTVNRKILLFGLALALAPVGPASAAAEPVGLLALYRVEDSMGYAQVLEQLGADLAAQGCAIRREGAISGANGPMTLPTADRFLILGCETALLEDRASRAALQPLRRAVAELVIAEGKLVLFEDSPRIDPERAYVLKISRYNNTDPDARDRDLSALSRDASGRAHAYRNEAVIAVSRAWGMVTPDEVTVLYYKSSAEGEAFRQGNGDLMKKIGQFNEDHLLDYSYLNGSAAR